jgi:long-chain acyl-CoA synthetase
MQMGIFQGYTQVILNSPYIDEILRAIAAYEPSFFISVPAIYEALKGYRKTDRVNWKNLKMVISSGDTLHGATSRGWKSRTGVNVTELYGMTEMGLTHMCPLEEKKIGTIGIPAPNIIAGIFDLNRNEFLPVGEIGEIAVKSPTVMKGYWNKPEASKDVLVEIGGEMWLRTGDLGKMDEDAYFYFYDRKRNLIKHKGLCVYAREVEEVLITHPNIKEVGVIGVPDVNEGQNAKALVVLETDARGKLFEAEIIKYCQGKLAQYKIPKLVEFVSEIPKTDVGKVSHRELRDAEGFE